MKTRQLFAFALLVSVALQPIPHAPTLHDIDNADGDGSFTVSWSYDYTDPPVDRYTLQEATDANFTTDRMDYDPGSSTSYAISSKESGTYYYRVQGHNLLWAGEWSNVKSATVGSSFSYYVYLPTLLSNREDVAQPVTPNDTYYSAYQWNLRQIRAPYAWALSTGSGDVIVAVLDTGADLNHPDLQGKLVSGYDVVNNDTDPADDDGHGTHVAGIVAARTNNSRGVAGVSWEGKIMPVKVLDWSGSGTHSQIAEGIRWAADHGAHIINLSLGGESGSSTLQEAINYAYNRGALVVASAGNSYQEGNPVIYPAAYPRVLAVAATGDQDEHARYSETGSYVDVAAPGGNPSGSWDTNSNHWIMSTYLGGSSYAQVAGTSQAAPHVAGLAALVWSVRPSLSNAQVEQIIEETAVDLGDSGRDDVFGHGRIDAYSALVSASSAALAAAPTLASPSLPSAQPFVTPTLRVPVRGTEPTAGEFAASVVLVKFRAGVREGTISSVLGKYSAQAASQIPALGLLRLSVPEGSEMEISERLSEEPAVEYAEPDYVVRAFRAQRTQADR
jgi:type VII secretion-associated serine protease mycosin